MNALKQSVTETTLARLVSYGIDVPADISSYVDEVEFSILNYCNLQQVPTELKFVWINMLLDYFRWVETLNPSSSGNSSSESSVPTVLTSLREGDTTLGFSADTSSAKYQASRAHKLSDVLDKIVLNYTDSLNRFRRVVW